MRIFSDSTLIAPPSRKPASASSLRPADSEPGGGERTLFGAESPPARPTSDQANARTQLAGDPTMMRAGTIIPGGETRWIWDAPTLPAGQASPTESARTIFGLDQNQLLASRYEIFKERAAGNYNSVFIAEDTKSGEIVILKTTSDAYLHHDEVRNNLVREAEALRAAPGDGAPSYHDLFFDQGCLFLAMERVRGVTLSNLMHNQGPFSLDSALSILEGLLHVLRSLHRAGRLHGDVKPSNTVLRRRRPVLIDFGATRMIDDQSDALRTMTPRFAAPEAFDRFEGKSWGELGPWTDIYASFSTAAACLLNARDRVALPNVQAELENIRGVLPDDVMDVISGVFAKGLSDASEQRFRTAEAALEQIEHVRKLMMGGAAASAAPMGDGAQVFVSYSSKDADYVEGLIAALKEAGANPWVDQSAIRVGDDWKASIVAALRNSILVIVFCTENSVGKSDPSQHVRREIDLALEADKRVIPLFKSGEEIELDDSAAYLLSGLHKCYWSGDAAHLGDVLNGLKAP